jgi:hypothetical protein
MARLSKVLLGVWLVWMFASGSAFAVVREIDLGVLSPGSVQGLFGVLPIGVETTDTYEFDVGGTGLTTVGASAVSLLTKVGSAGASFDLAARLLEWNGSSFVTISGTGITSSAVVTSADLPAATGGGNPFNRHYELTITATPTGSGIASYGGSISAVPEPSLSLLVIGGMISMVFLGRRRLTNSAA